MEWEKTALRTFENVWVFGSHEDHYFASKKLDDRSQKVVYFGVEEGSKAQRLYDSL